MGKPLKIEKFKIAFETTHKLARTLPDAYSKISFIKIEGQLIK